MRKGVERMSENKKDNKNIGQFLKFVVFSCSAGLIQIGSFTLMSEVLIKLSFFQGLMQSNATFAKMYLIALILSVVWNFTFNRKFTFKSANNVPIAMLKVFGYYLVFTPVSTVLGNYFTAKFASLTAVNYIVLGITMIVNMVTEYLFDKFVVFRGSEGTAQNKKSAKKDDEQVKEQA